MTDPGWRKLSFPEGRVKSNLLVNIGYGAAGGVFARNPRLDFEEACAIA